MAPMPPALCWRLLTLLLLPTLCVHDSPPAHSRIDWYRSQFVHAAAVATNLWHRGSYLSDCWTGLGIHADAHVTSEQNTILDDDQERPLMYSCGIDAMYR